MPPRKKNVDAEIRAELKKTLSISVEDVYLALTDMPEEKAEQLINVLGPIQPLVDIFLRRLIALQAIKFLNESGDRDEDMVARGISKGIVVIQDAMLEFKTEFDKRHTPDQPAEDPHSPTPEVVS